jgi:hypothetical protein
VYLCLIYQGDSAPLVDCQSCIRSVLGVKGDLQVVSEHLLVYGSRLIFRFKFVLVKDFQFGYSDEQ